jgi:thiol-disulfide isomerase/thioredoxin
VVSFLKLEKTYMIKSKKPHLKFIIQNLSVLMITYYRRLWAIAFFALLTSPIFAEEVNFIKDNVRVAIDKAASEGKLVFLDFWADYCSPCQLMEKYTFTDPSVIERMNGSYVPVRINIETFEGYDLKAQYNVRLLPTIIVLNSKGKQVARFEESMSGSKLTAILAKYDTKKNRKVYAKPAPEPVKAGFSTDFDVVAKPNTSTKPIIVPSKVVEKPAPVADAVVAAPRKEVATVAAPTTAKPVDKVSFKPPTVFGLAATTTATAKPVDVPTNYNKVAANRSVTKVEKPATFSAPSVAASSVATTNTARTVSVNNTTTAKHASVTSITAGYFTIQVGNFTVKDNADRASKAMKTQMDGKQKVFLLSGGSETLTTHRVMVGGFKSHKDATEFKVKNNIKGFVQNYSSYIRN